MSDATEIAGSMTGMRSLATLARSSAGRAEAQAPSMDYALQKATVILRCYRKADVDDPEGFLTAIAAVLSTYHPACMDAVTDPRFGIQTRIKFIPTASEVREACENYMEPIRRAEALDRRYAQTREAIAGNERKRLTADELRAKYGPNWGLESEGIKRPREETLDTFCATHGITREQCDALPNAP